MEETKTLQVMVMEEHKAQGEAEAVAMDAGRSWSKLNKERPCVRCFFGLNALPRLRQRHGQGLS